MPLWPATTANTACVTNEPSDHVSVVDLGSQTVTATIPVGDVPAHDRDPAERGSDNRYPPDDKTRFATILPAGLL